MERMSSRKFGDVGSSSLRNAKGLASVSGPGRRLLLGATSRAIPLWEGTATRLATV
ncbi:hypothetical protein GQ44DRAFT_707126 [Phaeosphaeriaceae sp. PMI808]|nr:hypothetical protein GQ44DRAFT_707126 [Phaeosphaeriaceae sp. PMI808]